MNESKINEIPPTTRIMVDWAVQEIQPRARPVVRVIPYNNMVSCIIAGYSPIPPGVTIMPTLPKTSDERAAPGLSPPVPGKQKKQT